MELFQVRLSLAVLAPGGGAGGDGVTGEFVSTLGAASAFFPAVLEKPIFGWDLADV